jgi:hypothetical protein
MLRHPVLFSTLAKNIYRRKQGEKTARDGRIQGTVRQYTLVKKRQNICSYGSCL